MVLAKTGPWQLKLYLLNKRKRDEKTMEISPASNREALTVAWPTQTTVRTSPGAAGHSRRTRGLYIEPGPGTIIMQATSPTYSYSFLTKQIVEEQHYCAHTV
jgi:hypothetical protein